MSALPVTYALGDHHGGTRLLARGLRALCRRPLARWLDRYLDADATHQVAAEWLTTFSPTGSCVAWVPGHDGSRGPGFELASIAADVWGLPLVDSLERHRPLPSAHAAPRRPSAVAQAASLMARPATAPVILMDNAIGSGASMQGAVAAFRRGGVDVGSIVVASIGGCR